MLEKLKKSCLLILMGLLASPLCLGANGGGWSGSGGDTSYFKDNVWFLNQGETVPYCLWRSTDYPYSYQELSSLVKESFKNWTSFFNSYGISKKELTLPRPGRNPLTLGRMAMNFKETGPCSSEAMLPKGLMFVFGKTNNIHIKRYNQYGAENALGLAIRNKHYNHETYTNPGYIWISSSSVLKEREKLKHLLLHELGHVFGMEHDSVFVMNTDIVSQLKNEKISDNRFIGKIETPSWPYDFLPRRPITLTYQRAVHQGRCPENYFPYRLLPREILHLLRPKLRRERRRPKGCFSLTLSWRKNRHKKKLRHYSLVIENLRGRQVTLKGLFDVTRPELIEAQTGPGVFTKWPMWRKGHFYRKKGMVPSRGTLTLMKRNPHGLKVFKMAAKISINKGITLEMAHPDFKKWWVLTGTQ
jgi:hypothetical protein